MVWTIINEPFNNFSDMTYLTYTDTWNNIFLQHLNE